MRVLVLSPYAETIVQTLTDAGDDWIAMTDPLTAGVAAEWIISFGYRHIISEPYLTLFAHRIININTSLLPWNRGSDPNFWSWFDRTPKGVSVHEIDRGLDSGPLLAQATVDFGDLENATLATTHLQLMQGAASLFASAWPDIRVGNLRATPQHGGGSYHRTSDKADWWRLLPAGNDTPVTLIERMGGAAAAWAQQQIASHFKQKE